MACDRVEELARSRVPELRDLPFRRCHRASVRREGCAVGGGVDRANRTPVVLEDPDLFSEPDEEAAAAGRHAAGLPTLGSVEPPVGVERKCGGANAASHSYDALVIEQEIARTVGQRNRAPVCCRRDDR